MARKAEKIAYKGTVKGVNTAKSLLSGGKTIVKGIGTLLNVGLNPFMKAKVGVTGIAAGVKYLMKNDKLQKKVQDRASEVLQSKSFAKNYVDPGKNIDVTTAMKGIKADKVKITRDRILAAQKIRTGLKELGTTSLAYGTLAGSFLGNMEKLSQSKVNLRKEQQKNASTIKKKTKTAGGVMY